MSKVTNQPPPTSLDRAKSTAKLTQATNNALLSSRTAEAAFDRTFDAQPIGDAADEHGPPQTQVSVEEQFQLFNALVPLIGQKPSGTASEPFELPKAPASEPLSLDDLQLALQTSAKQRGQTQRKLAPAIVNLSTALSAKKLATVQAQISRAMVAGQQVKLNPKALEQVKTQVVGPMLKMLKSALAQNGLGQSASADTAANSSVPAMTAGKDQASANSPVGTIIGGGNSSATPASGGSTTQTGQTDLTNAANWPALANAIPVTLPPGMDIDALVEYVIMECGNSSEIDLRNIAEQMQTNINQSAALRQVAEKQQADAASAKALVDQEYQTLVGEGAIDPSKCTQTTYENQRGMILSQPDVDPSTNPPTVTWTPPLSDSGSCVQLADPNPMNPSDVPAAFRYPPTPTAAQQYGLPDNVYNDLNALFTSLGSPGGNFDTWMQNAVGLTLPASDSSTASENIAQAAKFAQTEANPPPPSGNSQPKFAGANGINPVTHKPYGSGQASPQPPPAPPQPQLSKGVYNPITHQMMGGGASPPPAAKNSGGLILNKINPATHQEYTGYMSTSDLVTQLTSDLNGAKANLAPTTGQGGAGTPFTDASGNQVGTTGSSVAAWQQQTQDAVQDQSDMNQDMQLKMQLAQQQYTQCMQIVSNILKSDSDTKDAIIKNFVQ